MVRFLEGALPADGAIAPTGPVLTLKDYAALHRAPKARPGTSVTVRAYDIPWLPGKAEHMYVAYDDGREQLIARGGPSHLGDVLNGNLRVVAGVTPAWESRDHGQGGRVLHRGFLPDVAARDAAAGARAQAAQLARDHRAYSRRSNSNSFAADVAEDLFGVRPGDRLTPGHDRRLREAPRVRPYDISPALRRPGG